MTDPATKEGASAEKVPGPSTATSDDISRFLTLALHEEDVLNNRINIFLIVESILLVFAVEAGSRAPDIRVATFWCGVVITVVWLLMILRQWLDLKSATQFLHLHWPALESRKNYVPGFLKVLTLHAMLWVLPLTFICLWLAILRLPATFSLTQ